MPLDGGEGVEDRKKHIIPICRQVHSDVIAGCGVQFAHIAANDRGPDKFVVRFVMQSDGIGARSEVLEQEFGSSIWCRRSWCLRR